MVKLRRQDLSDRSPRAHVKSGVAGTRLATVLGGIQHNCVDNEGQPKVFKATVFDCCDAYWRVEYPDGDWEELRKREGGVGMGMAARPLPSLPE